jgi:hypothetical protein
MCYQVILTYIECYQQQYSHACRFLEQANSSMSFQLNLLEGIAYETHYRGLLETRATWDKGPKCAGQF